MLMPPEQGHLYALCPEWPSDPYLSIPLAERKRRFALLFPNETSSLAAQLEPRPAVPGELSLGTLNFIRELLGDEEKREEDVVLRIPWGMSDKGILRRVDAWLKTHRTFKSRADVSNRYLQAELKALGAFRILRAKNGDWTGDPQLYVEQSEWIRARIRAKSIIEKIDKRWA